MKAAIFRGPRNFEVQEIPTPAVGERDVLIQVDYCSICGSDLHTYTKGLYVSPGQIMGHEFGGTIVELGSALKDKGFHVGQRVVTNPTIACGHCVMCRKGMPNICETALTRTLAYGKPGAFAQYVLQGGDGFFYPLPESVSTKEGAMMEPLAVAVHAVKRANLSLNDTAVVFGAGTLGLLVSQVLKSIGNIRVIQVDLSEKRLEVARQTGVDYTINPAEVEDVVAEIAAITGPGYYGPGGAAADVVFECAGVPATVLQSLRVVRHGGTVVTLALAEKPAPIDITVITQKQISFLGTYAYTNDFEEAVDLVASGKVRVEPLISHVYPLAQIGEAFEMQLNAKESVKVVVDCRQ